MATKAKTKTKTNKPAPKGKGNKWASVQLPEGFKPITGGEFGVPWDFESIPTLCGVVQGDIRTVEQGKGKDKREARVITIENEDDGIRYDVWESAALRGFFDKVAEGMRVSVIFQGYRDTGKQSPMKVFVGAIAEDDLPDDDAPPARKTAKKRR